MSKMVGVHLLIQQVLNIAVRTAAIPAYLGTIEEMERELTKIIEDFDRTVDIEALRLARKSGKHSCYQSDDYSC